MKGTVSKAVSKVQSNYMLPRAVHNGAPLTRTCGRVAYHTFAAGRTRVQPTVSNVPLFTSPLTLNTKRSAHPATQVLSSSKLPREIVWLLGAPGAGKGTNSSHVAQSCGIQAPTIVMSSLLENPECKRIKDAGGMVDDATAFRALMEELSKPQYRDGAVVDGFPRTREQAEMLSRMHESLSETGIPPKFSFVMLSLSESTSVARQLSRGIHTHQLNAMRKLSGLEPLEARATDVCEAAALTRYRVYAEQVDAVTQLSADFRLAIVDADAPLDTVRSRLTAALKPTIQIPTQRNTAEIPLFARFGGLGMAFA